MTERPEKAASSVLTNICSPSAVTPILYSLFPSMTQNPKHASCFSHHLHNFLVCLRKTAQQLCVLQSFAVTEMLISPCTVHLLLTSWWVSHACKWLYSSSLGHPGAVCHFTFLCVCFWLVDFFFLPHRGDSGLRSVQLLSTWGRRTAESSGGLSSGWVVATVFLWQSALCWGELCRKKQECLILFFPLPRVLVSISSKREDEGNEMGQNPCFNWSMWGPKELLRRPDLQESGVGMCFFLK